MQWDIAIFDNWGTYAHCDELWKSIWMQAKSLNDSNLKIDKLYVWSAFLRDRLTIKVDRNIRETRTEVQTSFEEGVQNLFP